MAGRAITQLCPRCQMPLVVPDTFVGRTATCSRCLLEFTVVGTSPGQAKVAMPVGPKPPHLASRWSEEPKEPVAADKAVERDTPDEGPVVQGWPWWLLGCASLLVILAVSIVILLAVFVFVSSSWNSPFSGQPEPLTETKIDPAFDFVAQNANNQWWDAKKSTMTVAGVMVRVDAVEIGSVRHSSKGVNLETPNDNYLMITVVIKNKGRVEPVAYKSWYSYEFDEEGLKRSAQLIDRNGVKLPLFPIPGSERVERHVASDVTLPRGDETIDTLVFKLSEDYADERPQDMRLSLPAAAIEDDGFYQFFIPADMIERR